MLGLKLVTDPRWVNIVESNIEEIWQTTRGEQKAASNAISLITPKFWKIHHRINDYVREELEHLQMVHDLINKQRIEFGPWISLRKWICLNSWKKGW
jgi:tRNA-(ms[2]io[6]A)-hydroxylase